MDSAQADVRQQVDEELLAEFLRVLRDGSHPGDDSDFLAAKESEDALRIDLLNLDIEVLLIGVQLLRRLLDRFLVGFCLNLDKIHTASSGRLFVGVILLCDG